MKINFGNHKEYTETSGRAGNAAVSMSDVTVTCRYLPIFLWCVAVPVHTDVKRPEMWSKLIKEETTEALAVDSISFDNESPVHLSVKKMT